MVAKIGENFNVSEDDKVVENFYMENFVDINDWLKGVTPSPVIFFYDGRQFDEKDEKQKEGDPEVKMAFGTRSRLPPGSPTCSDFVLFWDLVLSSAVGRLSGQGRLLFKDRQDHQPQGGTRHHPVVW